MAVILSQAVAVILSQAVAVILSQAVAVILSRASASEHGERIALQARQFPLF